MTRRRIYLWVVCVFAALAEAIVAAASPVQVTTKPKIYPGEQFNILISYTEPAVLTFGQIPETEYLMDDVYDSVENYFQIVVDVTTPRTWTNTHSWHQYKLALGQHKVLGTVSGYGSASNGFEVVAAPSPPGDFLIDFEMIPGTSARAAHVLAYTGAGVHFRTSLGRDCSLRMNDTNSWAEGFDPYPAGFNVSARFDKPIFGATARVAGAAGVRITMLAKNADGQSIASDVSAPNTQPGQFEHTLSVRTTEPIASLEWWPSANNSVVKVDDVFLITRPKISVKQIGKNLQITWPTSPGATYQVWASTNLATWSPTGSILNGTGGVLTNEYSTAERGALFLRVVKD